jgi:DNA invertase Pin-like site-specific DNA recombinase
MRRAFTIIRVSEEDQLRGYGPDVQADEVQAYLHEAGLEEIGRKVVQEESTTWARPQFEAVLDEAIDLKRRGELDAVAFPRTDRLARKWDAFGYYLGKLRREGLEVHFAREKTIAPDDPMQAAMLFLYGAKAHADADTIRANTTWGRRMRVERDKMMPTGGHKWAFDYHYYSRHSHEPPDSNSGRYTVNSERAAWVKRWARWILEDGQSVNWCCERMTMVEGRKWWPSTMVAILSDPALLGKFYAYRTRNIRGRKGWTKQYLKPEEWKLVYEDPNQEIMTSQEFYALQDKFEQNRVNAKRNTGHWYPPLRALIFCGCGRRMTGYTIRKKPRYRYIRQSNSYIIISLRKGKRRTSSFKPWNDALSNG